MNVSANNAPQHSIRAGVASFVVALLAALACLAALPAQGYASTYSPVTASIPVEVAVSGDNAPEQEFQFAIEPAEGETVMPEETQISVAGVGSSSFEVSFNQVGEHRYKVYQTTSAAENWDFDSQVYEVTAYCMWDEATNTLYTKVLCRDQNGFKAARCNFQNAYSAPAEVGQPESAESADNAASAGVKTGDFLMGAVAMLVVVAAVAAAVAVVVRRKRSKGEF